MKDRWQLLIDWNQDVITFLSQGKMSERFRQLNSMKPKVNKENNSASTAVLQPTPSSSKPSTVPQPRKTTSGKFVPQPNKMSSAMPVGFILLPVDQNTTISGDGITPPLSSMLNETANTMREFDNTLVSKLPNRMFSFLHHIKQLLESKLGPDITREFHNIFMKSIFLNHSFETKELSIDVPIIESSSDQTIFDIVSSVLLAAMSSKEPDLIQKMEKKLHARHGRGQPQLTMSSILRQSKYSGYGFKFLKEKGPEILSKDIQIKALKKLSAELLKFLIDSNIRTSNSIPVDLTQGDPLFEPLSFVLTDLVKTMFINSNEVATEVKESISLPIDVLPPEDCDYIAQQIYNKVFAHSFSFFIGRCPMTVTVDRILLSLTPQSLHIDFKNQPDRSNFRKSNVQIGFPVPSIESLINPFWNSLPKPKELQENVNVLTEVSRWKTDRLEQREKVSTAQQKSIKKLEEEQLSLAKEIEKLEKQWQEINAQMKKLQADNKILFQQKSEIEDKYPNPTTIQNQSRHFSKQISSLNKQIEKLQKKEEK